VSFSDTHTSPGNIPEKSQQYSASKATLASVLGQNLRFSRNQVEPNPINERRCQKSLLE
jgi:hypothetical protein